MASSSYIRPSQSSGFTYYYPDVHPTAFVSFLGAGHQGAAILVRSMVDGELYVRKRSRLAQNHTGFEHNETKNAIPHPNIPRLVAQTPLAPPACGTASTTPSTADLWAHCNGGDLVDLVARYSAKEERVPEILVWQLMHQLLPTVLHLHDHHIAHADIIHDSIFVHWPTDASDCPDSRSTPPKFLIGDFGCSYGLPPDENVKITHGISETSEAVYGDLTDLAGCIDLVMNGGEAMGLASAKRGHGYSRGLLRVLGTLALLPRVLQRFEVARACDGEMFSHIVDPLLRDIETGLKLEQEAKYKQPDFRPLRPRQRKLAKGPFMFGSREALLAWPYRPPGPWCIAEIDSKGKLIQTDLQEKFCEDQVMVTKHGNEVEEAEVRHRWKQACW